MKISAAGPFSHASEACQFPEIIPATILGFDLVGRLPAAHAGGIGLDAATEADMEAQVEAGHRGRDVRVDPERIGVQGVHSEHVPVRGVTLRRRGPAEVLGAIVVADAERASGQAGAAALSPDDYRITGIEASFEGDEHS
mgnify:CR=1 FL=1